MAKRLPFLYVGKNGNGTEHEMYTVQELKAYVYPSQFVIVPGNYWEYFTSGGALTSEATELAGQIATLAKLICNNTSTNFYIGTPTLTDRVNNCYTSSDSAYRAAYGQLKSSFKSFIEDVKKKIGATLFDSRCDGVYMNVEEMGNYELELSNMDNHPHYALFKYVSDYVHNTLGKELIWAPYYSYNTTIQNIAKMAATTVFDYIFMQPHWYFEDADAAGNTYSNNCLQVYKSVRDKKIYDRDGNLVNFGTVKTILGVQMEVDSQYYPANTSNKYYRKYQDYYKQFYPYRWQYNFGFYHGHHLESTEEHHPNESSYYPRVVKEIVAPFIS